MFTIEQKFQLYSLIKAYEKLEEENYEYIGENFILEKNSPFFWNFEEFLSFLETKEFITKEEYENTKEKYIRDLSLGQTLFLDLYIININDKAKENFDYWFVEYISSKDIKFKEYINNLELHMLKNINSKKYELSTEKSKKMSELLKNPYPFRKNSYKIIYEDKLNTILEQLEILEEIVSSNIELDLIKKIKESLN